LVTGVHEAVYEMGCVLNRTCGRKIGSCEPSPGRGRAAFCEARMKRSGLSMRCDLNKATLYRFESDCVFTRICSRQKTAELGQKCRGKVYQPQTNTIIVLVYFCATVRVLATRKPSTHEKAWKGEGAERGRGVAFTSSLTRIVTPF
jgi:hypothetical protein